MIKFNSKLLLLAAIVLAVSFGGRFAGLAVNTTQQITLAVFAGVISTTLFFWERRVAAAFIGVAILISCHAMTLHTILKATELDIIFFLVGMMIIVGVLKDLGFLTWVIQTIINRRKMNGVSFSLILCVLSAVLASVVDEVRYAQTEASSLRADGGDGHQYRIFCHDARQSGGHLHRQQGGLHVRPVPGGKPGEAPKLRHASSLRKQVVEQPLLEYLVSRKGKLPGITLFEFLN